jgi:ubiquinone/menaquinone biosynthesis C-methylase UbiE
LPLAGASDVLDVGCGGGGGVRRLADLAPEAVIRGVDHSPDSLRVAERALEALVARGRVVLRQGSVSALPFDSGSIAGGGSKEASEVDVSQPPEGPIL